MVSQYGLDQTSKHQDHGNQTVDSLYEPNSMDEQQLKTDTTMMQHRTAHSGVASYVKNSQAIKPSVSFMNLSREQSKLQHFVDLQDGPSSLQKTNVPTLREKMNAPLVFETERAQFMSTTTKNMQMLKEVRTALFDNDPTRSA